MHKELSDEMPEEETVRYTTKRISITTVPGKIRHVATRLILSPDFVDVYLDNGSNSLRATAVASDNIELSKLVEEWSEGQYIEKIKYVG